MMAEMYTRLIKNSQEKGNEDWTLGRVPEKFRKDVEIKLQEGDHDN